jgi:hypothetical protein
MNNACAWFTAEYPDATALRVLVMPTRKLAKGAGVNEEVRIMRAKHLRALAKNVTAFFAEFGGTPLLDITEAQVQARLATHKLTVKDLASDIYSDLPILTKSSSTLSQHSPSSQASIRVLTERETAPFSVSHRRSVVGSTSISFAATRIDSPRACA